MEEDRKITKIVIGKDDELTDIVSGIIDSSNERILVTFAEDSDLLISPINLKVILEVADERQKSVIAQIIKNPTGIRNANIAGLTTIDTPAYPTNEMWEKEMINRARRSGPVKKKEVVEVEPIEERQSRFQDKVDSVLENHLKKEDDLYITFDEDITAQDDFSNGLENKPVPLEDSEEIKTKREFPIIPKIKTLLSKITLPTKIKGFLPLIAIGIVVISVLLAFVYYYTVPFVKVRIYVAAKEASIEKVFDGDENIKGIDFANSKIPVKTENVEKSRSNNIKATGTAFRGDKAKGKVNIAYVKVGSCAGVSALNLSQGHLITSSSAGKSFKLDSAVSIECNNISEASVTAVEVGEEYNLSSGNYFAVQGFSSTDVFATSGGAFTGGTKQQYTVLSQADINSGVEELKKIAIEEGERELKEKSSGWEIIVDSISSEVLKESIKTDKEVGAEANEVNLSITTKSSATYFLKEGFDIGIADLLTKEAIAKNLFESDKNLELALGDDIEKSVTVLENSKNGIKIKLVAKGSVKPKVDKESILNSLKSKKWEEGKEYLKTLIFSDKDTEIIFKPDNFPKSLYHYPSRQGGVLIEIKEVL